MIFIFNRKELEITTSLKRRKKIESILTQNQIDYKVKIVNEAGILPFVGRNKQKEVHSYAYIIYVHKMDYEKAGYLLHK